MERNYKKMVSALEANIPTSVVSKRKAGGGMQLSYLEGWYVMDKMNEIFGQGNWQYDTREVKLAHEAVIQKNGKTGRAVSYYAIVELSAAFPAGEDGTESVVTFTDVGAGKGIDYNSGLEADEMALKEAVTDGFKRCAKSLGKSLGLALYDKTQKYVGGTAKTATKATTKRAAPKAAGNGKSVTGPLADIGSMTDKQVMDRITDTSRVLIAQKAKSKDDLVALMQDRFGVTEKSKLSAAQAKEFLGELSTLI